MRIPEVRLFLLVLIVLVSLFLMLWRPKGIAEAWWISGAVVLLLITRLMPLRAAWQAVRKGTDVYLFLIGMMLLSELAREHGVFDWLAVSAVRLAQGSRARLFLLVYGTGIITTALLSNDATAVVMTPAVLAAVKRVGGKAAPFLFACAMVANAASFLLPISNPGNLVVFRQHLPTLTRWLAVFLLPSLASVATTFVVLRFWFRRELCGGFDCTEEVPPITRAGWLTIAGIGAITALLLTASVLQWRLGLPTCLASLVLVLLVSATASTEMPEGLRRIAQGVSWSILPLVAGLFCLLEAVERAGLARVAVHTLQAVAAWPRPASVFGLGLGIGVLDNLANNLPVGMLAGAAVSGAKVHTTLTGAVLIAVDLGPNLSVTGSLATILWLTRIRREGAEIRGTRFLKAGLIAMPLAIVASLAALLLER